MKWSIFPVATLCALILACEPAPSDSAFDLNGVSKLVASNTTEDTLNVVLSNWLALPKYDQQREQAKIPPHGTHTFLVKTQNKNYCTVTIGERTHKLFISPGNVDSLALVGEEFLTPFFFGSAKTINEFLFNEQQKYGDDEPDIRARSSATHSAEDFDLVLHVNDSVTEALISYVYQHEEELPKWYVDFEIARLKYVNVGFKLNSFFYRKAMLDKRDTLPTNFLAEITQYVEPENPNLVGNLDYGQFMDDYLHFRIDSTFSFPRPSSADEIKESYKTLIAATGKELKGLSKDYYITVAITKAIKGVRYLVDSTWMTAIADARLRQFAFDQLALTEVLPPGATTPYFNLIGLEGGYYEPKAFQNSIVLINFWATWCKPCIKEFPDENRLVEQFEGKPVTIFNIGLDEKQDTWEKTIARHQPKAFHLFAQGNWHNLIYEKFGITALPHSVLIDQNGKVVQNKCARASAGIEEQITVLLQKMKEENANTGN
jgi:thiol-disulfide isomerase/thioredoxin